MKKSLSLAVCALVLCSLLLVGVVNAGNAAYSITEMPSIAPCTVDGRWTTADEWNDGPFRAMEGNTSGMMAYLIQDFTALSLEWIVEITTDTTNDPGDYWQICLDSDNSGGTAPQSGDLKIEITGHTTMKVYQGTGSGWAEIAPVAGEVTWSNTIAASKFSATPHWILEVVAADKTTGNIVTGQPPNGMMVAAFDDSTDRYTAWAPNARANVPNSWGVISGYSMENTAPEGITFVAILIVSSVAILGGFYYQRKQRKTN